MTGVSGSGKSTLINDTLHRVLAGELHGLLVPPGAHRRVVGLDQIDKVVDVDQRPIGRSPRSNPATYSGVFSGIRGLFAALPESRVRGWGTGRFSFNVKGGRCEACEGDGAIRVEMQFLPDVFVPCEVCSGRRYDRDTLSIRYRGKSIADVLEMTALEALELFESVPPVARPTPGPRRCRFGLRSTGPERNNAIRRRGAAHETREGTRSKGDGADSLLV